MYSGSNVGAVPATIDDTTKRASASTGYGHNNDARAAFQAYNSYHDPTGVSPNSAPVTPGIQYAVNTFNSAVPPSIDTQQMAPNNFSHMNNYAVGSTIRPHTSSSAITGAPKVPPLSRGYDSAIDLSGMAHLPMLNQPSFSPIGLSDTASPINTSFPLQQSPLQQIPLAPQTPAMASTVHSPVPPMDVYMPQETTPITPQVTPQMRSMSSTGPIVGILLQQNKTTVRPEVEMKMKLSLTLQSPDQYRYIRFPREHLARPSQLATDGEVSNNARSSIYVSLHLVSDSYVRTPSGKEHAMSRARGDHPFPHRDPDVAATDLPKDDPAHPSNGGKMIICKQCRTRERKRYGRKKQVDEERWGYESERIILINENEFKRLAHPTNSQFVKSVDFKMRILCYNRHQDCLDPDGRAYSGYRVLFTFKDCGGEVLAQHLSDVYHIADDHKDAKVLQTSMAAAAAAAAAFSPHTLGNGMPSAAYAQPTQQLAFQQSQAALNAARYAPAPQAAYASYDAYQWGH